MQVSKLIEDSEKTKNTKVSMSQDAITEWLLQNKVLSIAFESKFLLITISYCCYDTMVVNSPTSEGNKPDQLVRAKPWLG